jgi:hypothetical protein
VTCPACAESRINRWCGHYRADCQDCTARGIYHSHARYEAEKAGYVTRAYENLLRDKFGDDDWLKGHDMVKGWAKMSTLPADIARCNGYQDDGEWREGCEDCLRRTVPPADPGRRIPP